MPPDRLLRQASLCGVNELKAAESEESGRERLALAGWLAGTKIKRNGKTALACLSPLASINSKPFSMGLIADPAQVGRF